MEDTEIIPASADDNNVATTTDDEGYTTAAGAMDETFMTAASGRDSTDISADISEIDTDESLDDGAEDNAIGTVPEVKGIGGGFDFQDAYDVDGVNGNDIGNHLILGAIDGAGPISGNLLTPLESYRIDIKIDDGLHD